jgi:hypothetical protein
MPILPIEEDYEEEERGQPDDTFVLVIRGGEKTIFTGKEAAVLAEYADVVIAQNG